MFGKNLQIICSYSKLKGSPMGFGWMKTKTAAPVLNSKDNTMKRHAILFIAWVPIQYKDDILPV